ncbi:hypothetical protein DFR58_104127 [Anaerobacterium chartisolvens]|uniref:Uncharacterized protein n=1 Tax=Anaerobacterium chartisolvens TaxID=1297424 RepID=A0A369BE24_9FIRM|nr:hypothetical protein [Anaerobacterium chartisolvens]RCX18858.1 hypothetical protein DFR58_104127 [Anaerobacterium chartisolvens]
MDKSCSPRDPVRPLTKPAYKEYSREGQKKSDKGTAERVKTILSEISGYNSCKNVAEESWGRIRPLPQRSEGPKGKRRNRTP